MCIIFGIVQNQDHSTKATARSTHTQFCVRSFRWNAILSFYYCCCCSCCCLFWIILLLFLFFAGWHISFLCDSLLFVCFFSLPPTPTFSLPSRCLSLSLNTLQSWFMYDELKINLLLIGSWTCCHSVIIVVSCRHHHRHSHHRGSVFICVCTLYHSSGFASCYLFYSFVILFQFRFIFLRALFHSLWSTCMRTIVVITFGNRCGGDWMISNWLYFILLL